MHSTNKPIRLSEIDDTNRESHTRLTEADLCMFLYEKTSGRDYKFSDTNSLISNLKKPVTSKASELKHKDRAIQRCAAAFREAINPQLLQQATLVPVPPSMAPTYHAYDDRMNKYVA